MESNVDVVLLSLALAFIMLALGLGLTFRDFARVLRHPRDFAVGAVSQIVVLPTVAFTLASIWPLAPELALGLMILAAAPGGVTSNILTAFARGDVALSISLTAVISLLSVITIPFIVVFSHGHFIDGQTENDISVAATAAPIFLLVTVPVLIGLLVRHFAEGFALSVDPAARKVSAGLFVLVLAGAIYEQHENIGPYFRQAGLVTLFFNVLMMVIAHIVARLFATGGTQRIAISIECGLQNVTVALTLATSLSLNHLVAMPAATYGLTMFATALIYITVLRRVPRTLPSTAGEPTATSTTTGTGFTTSPDVVLKAEAKHINGCSSTKLIGLALSGGGIRSAAFALGVVESLGTGNVLKTIDYISTVSGGGYIGAAITWWLHRKHANDREARPSAEASPSATPLSAVEGEPVNSIVTFLRFRSNYLVPTRTLNLPSIVFLLIRNALVSGFVYFGLLVIITMCVVALLSVIHTSTAHTLFELPEHIFASLRGMTTHLSWAYVLTGLQSLATWFFAPIVASVNVAITIARLVPIPNLTDQAALLRLVELCIYGIWTLLILSICYSIFTLWYQFRQNRDCKSDWATRRYHKRTMSQRLFGRVGVVLTLLSVAVLPPLLIGVSSNIQGGAVLVIVAVFVGSVLLFWWQGGWSGNTADERTEQRVKTVAAILFLFDTALAAYYMARLALNWSASIGLAAYVGLVLAASAVLAVGLLVNVNYLGVHRMYRDRLMELFLPDNRTVSSNKWAPALQANRGMIEKMCQGDHVRPYHLINANVVLTDSEVNQYRGRGGASFILSPLYCGSDATGWRPSTEYMKGADPGMTLATAMAISGAAANPHAGAGGAGWTRNRIVATVLSILNLRLGYWAPNPNPNVKAPKLVPRCLKEVPNLLYPGLLPVFLGGRLKEDYFILDLTDGGHFENLGLYELIRRKVALIVVVDSSTDGATEFVDLGTALERARVDFGARIDFSGGRYPLEGIRRGERGFAVARIEYTKGERGKLVYLKPTLVSGLNPEIESYSKAHSNFPHEPTTDQFFDERQFEAYRELGLMLGREALPEVALDPRD